MTLGESREKMIAMSDESEENGEDTSVETLEKALVSETSEEDPRQGSSEDSEED